MPLKILTNNCFKLTSSLKITDTSNVETSEQYGSENLVFGSPHLYWKSSDTAEKRIAYIDKSGRLTSTHFVLVRADRHLGHKINLYKASNYASSISSIVSSNDPIVSADLIGKYSQDLVLEASATSQQALIAEFKSGTGGVYTKYIHQCYFSNAFTINYPSSYIYAKLSFPSYYNFKNKSYLIDGRFKLSVNGLTQSEVDQFQNLYKVRQEPFCIYDSSGDYFRYNLVHCLLETYSKVQIDDDTFILSLDLVELRRWQ